MAIHPSVGDMVKHPYGVVSNYVDPDGQIYPGVYANAVSGFVPSFEYHYSNLLSGFLLQAAANEQAKEIAYINEMMACFDDDLRHSVLYQNFLEIYKAVMSKGSGASLNLSLLVDTIQKMKMGLYELDKEVKENHEIYKEINLAFLDKNVVDELKAALKYEGAGSSLKLLPGLNIEMTGSEIIDGIIANVERKMMDAVENSGLDKETKEGQAVIERYKQNIKNIIEFYNVKLREFYSQKFLAVDQAENILNMTIKELDEATQAYDKTVSSSNKIMIHKKSKNKGKPKTIHQTLVDAISGVWGGKSPEFILDIINGSINTGNIQGKSGQSIDADNIELGNGEISYFNNKKNREKFDGITTFDEFLDQIKRIEDFETKFMIMYSAKDQSVSKEFKNMVAHSDVKIKGDAALRARGPEIINMYNMIDHPGAMDPTDLIFSIANLAQEFVCSGQTEQAKQTLGAICVGWMFDDVEQIVKGSSLVQGTSGIHFYNINNYFYTLSDILYKTATSLNDVGVSQSKYVKIGISVPKGNIYSNLIENVEEGMQRWETVANNLLDNIKINIHMNPNSLYKDLFGSLF